VLHAVLEAAVTATTAIAGWIVVPVDGKLAVRAAVGSDTSSLVGRPAEATGGTAGFALATGQPLALTLRADDSRRDEGVPALLGLRPTTVLVVPCAGPDGIVGALELVDKQLGSFDFDDLEVTTLLAGIATAALSVSDGPALTPPRELSGRLQRLADDDPTRYATICTVIDALLGSA
jgi:hypothetical protein